MCMMKLGILSSIAVLVTSVTFSSRRIKMRHIVVLNFPLSGFVWLVVFLQKRASTSISYTGEAYAELCSLADVNSLVIIHLGFGFATGLFSHLRMIANNWQSDIIHLTGLRYTVTL